MSLTTQCQVCCGNVATVLPLGSSPPSCSMPELGEWGPEMFYPLGLVQCEDCKLVQLSYVVDPELVFYPTYPYRSGNSPQLQAHFADLGQRISRFVHEDDLVVDIGANDGTLLKSIEGCQRLGVEPTQQAHHLYPDGDIPAWKDFFSLDVARLIRFSYGKAKVITACNVLAHCDDINEVMQGISELLTDDGILIAENGDVGIILDGAWDVVYAEHQRYYSASTFKYLCERSGLTVLVQVPIDTHGGSVRTIACKESSASQVRSALGSDGLGTSWFGQAMARLPLDPTPKDFIRLEQRMKVTRAHLRSHLAVLAAGGKRVVGLGATARASTMISYFGLGRQDIEAVLEVEGSDKIGKYMAGTRIPVFPEAKYLHPFPPDFALIFSWHMADRIMESLRVKGYQGTFIVPLPHPRLVPPRKTKQRAGF